MSVESAAAQSAARNQQQVATQVGIRTLQIAKQQSQSVLSLLDAAVQAAEQIQSTNPALGRAVDVTA